MSKLSRTPGSRVAVTGIILTTLALLGFYVFSTRESSAALDELREQQHLADQYSILQVKIVAAEGAFYEALLFPSSATRQKLDEAIESAFAQSNVIATISPAEAARQARSYAKFAEPLALLNQTLAGDDLGAVYDLVLDGSNVISDLVEDASANAALLKAESDATAARFEHTQEMRLWLAVGVNLVGLGFVTWLAIVIRQNTRRQVELAVQNQVLESSSARAERASYEKSEFLSRMSHELRTPMNAVLGFGQLLQLDDLSKEQRENVDYIMSSGRHLLRLIDEVLDLSRIEAGKLELSLEAFEPDMVVTEVVQMMRHLAANSGIELTVYPAPDGIRAVGDVQRTKQVLLNLVSNAVKYNRPGGRVAIDVTSGADGRVAFSVSDTGRGISEEKLDRLFVAFDRLDAEGSNVEGTGLGLTVSRVLVEAMNGTLTVESAVDHGSTFSIHLPAAVAEVVTNTEHTRTEARDESFSILYIEDNLSNFGLVARWLRQRGDVRLLAARTGSEGITRAREGRPSLILLDYHLPDMTGLDVLEVLKMDAVTMDCPVVVLTASRSLRLAEEARQRGAVSVLRKPLDLSELLETIAQANQGPHPAAA